MSRRPRAHRLLVAVGLAIAAIWAVPAASQSPPGVVATIDPSGPSRPAGCGEVDLGGRLARSRCQTEAYDFDARLSVRNALGAFVFGDCVVAMDVSVAGDGRIWGDNIKIGGASPCNDVRPCAPAAVLATLEEPADAALPHQGRPWEGRIRQGSANGRFDGELEVCVDTCLGRYEGRTAISLRRDDSGGWRMRAAKAGVGTSGLEIDADWDLDVPRGFALRDAD